MKDERRCWNVLHKKKSPCLEVLGHLVTQVHEDCPHLGVLTHPVPEDSHLAESAWIPVPVDCHLGEYRHPVPEDCPTWKCLGNPVTEDCTLHGCVRTIQAVPEDYP